MFAGVGGGNFASSMTNINAYYPARLKGWALGINAGGGNLGVPVVQLVGLLVLATLGAQLPAGDGRDLHPADHPGRHRRRALHGQPDPEQQRQGRDPGGHHGIARPGSCRCSTSAPSARSSASASPSVRCCWCSSPSSSPSPVKAAALTFLGPLLGSLIRPFGGALADRFKGSVVTFWNFIAMAVGRGHRADRLAAELAAGVLDRLRDALRLQRARQRVDLQDDPDDLPRQGPARGRRRRGRGRRATSGPSAAPVR